MAQASENSCSALPVLSNVVIQFWKLLLSYSPWRNGGIWSGFFSLDSLDSDLLIGPEHNVKTVFQ